MGEWFILGWGRGLCWDGGGDYVRGEELRLECARGLFWGRGGAYVGVRERLMLIRGRGLCQRGELY